MPDRDVNSVILIGTDGEPYEIGASGGVSQQDNTAFTAGTDSGTPIMGYVGNDSVTAGRVGTVRMQATREQAVTLYNTSGVAIAAATPLQTSAGIVNTNHTGVSGLGLVDASGTPRPLALGMYNGSNYDSIRGDTTNGLDVDVTRSALPSGASTLAEQQTQTASLSVMDDWDNGASDGASVSGDVAHDTADAGEPVKIGFRAFSPDGTAPGTAVAENDRVNGKADLDGRQYVSTVHPEMWSYHDDDAAAVTTDGTLHADPGDGFAVYITDIVWSIGAATASTLFIEEGSTKILGPYNLPATIGAGMALHFTTPKKCTASTAILITNTGSINFAIDVMGYVAAV